MERFNPKAAKGGAAKEVVLETFEKIHRKTHVLESLFYQNETATQMVSY